MQPEKNPMRTAEPGGSLPAILALPIAAAIMGAIFLAPDLLGSHTDAGEHHKHHGHGKSGGSGSSSPARTDARKHGNKSHAPSHHPESGSLPRPHRPGGRLRRSQPSPSPSPPPSPPPPPGATAVGNPMVVLGFNNLGMHCMNQDFSELCLLPPYNNLHAQVIDRRGEDPRIVSDGSIQIQYQIPGNTFSVGKTNFWTYAQSLFGVKLASNIGLTGNGLSGSLKPTGLGDYAATGIPLTPITDNNQLNPYQLSSITVKSGGTTMAATQAVVPVSWEISCNLCHNSAGVSTATDILIKHDALHGTNLINQKPVLCAKCHADPALGTSGVQGVSTLSRAMHGAHASRMGTVSGKVSVDCYACHPGIHTQCQRDIHYAMGITCHKCHGDMTAVADPARTPWKSEPRCDNCHNTPGHTYEQPGTLYQDSKGHNGVKCASCHGSPHAITPTVTAPDNVQAINLQGHAGTINTCTVCHRSTPDDSFNHTYGEGGGGGGSGGGDGGGGGGDN